MELVEQGEHLTLEGLNKISSIKAVLNKGLSDSLISAFPNITSVLRRRPEVENSKIANLH